MRKLLFFALLILSLASCKKDETTDPNTNPVKDYNYFPLQVGNYWVYKHVDIDSLGNETERPGTDSTVITRDTTINGNKYFILEGTNILEGIKSSSSVKQWGILDFLRDSSGYLVNSAGMILFAENNFTDTLLSNIEVINNDTLYTLYYRMEKPANQITVPAGKFEVLNFKGTVTTPQNIPGVRNPRYLNHYYADNVGRIVDTYFFLNSPNVTEKRLVRYKVGNTK